MKQILTLFLFLSLSMTLQAQRISYPQLVNRAQAPQLFINEIFLPDSDSTVSANILVRLNNNFLPFKKIPLDAEFSYPDDAEFFTPVSITGEIFAGKSKNNRNNYAESSGRDVWLDTLYASDYDASQSKKLHTTAVLETKLSPGDYHYMLQLTLADASNERSSRSQDIKVPDLSDEQNGQVYFIHSESSELNNGNKVYELLNLADNVPYGNDFHALIYLPEFDSNDSYSVEINEVKVNRNDTVAIHSVWKQSISKSDVINTSSIRIKNDRSPYLELADSNGALYVASLKIPHSTFKNSAYRINVYKNKNKDAIASRFFRSYWPDMPASLYNLNIAISNLEFILSDERIREMKKGNDAEKERKFRAFWSERDPTPGTVFNELMAEYYRRIDYAFREFGTPENPMGHKSDQGKVYITNGPPQSKDRQFPTDESVREIWVYDNKSYVFESTTGFGDFKLVAVR